MASNPADVATTSDEANTQEQDPEFTKVTIAMPKSMHEALRQRARQRGITVTELMRRAVALDRVVFDPNHPEREVILREGDTERTLMLLDR